MAFPARKDEYRPEFAKITERLLETPDFVAALESFITVALDGHPRWYPESLQTFGQLVKHIAVRAEDHLTEEYFDGEGI